MEYADYPSEKVIDLGSKKASPRQGSLILALLLFLAAFSLAAFGVGWLWGQTNQGDQSTGEQKSVDTSSIKAPEGKDIYLDPDEGYQVTYPKDWKAAGKSGQTAGVSLKKDTSSVDISLTSKKTELSKEQTAKLEKTNKIELVVDGKKVAATENIFKDDTYLTTGTVPATDKSPQVSFVITATDEVAYPQAKEIVSSIHFL